jgi:hypothetical protein
MRRYPKSRNILRRRIARFLAIPHLPGYYRGVIVDVAAPPSPSPDPSASVLMEAPQPSAAASGGEALRPLFGLLVAAAVACGRR